MLDNYRPNSNIKHIYKGKTILITGSVGTVGSEVLRQILDLEPAEVRLYDHLFTKETPDDVEEGEDFTDYLNPDSLKTVTAKVEPSLESA